MKSSLCEGSFENGFFIVWAVVVILFLVSLYKVYKNQREDIKVSFFQELYILFAGILGPVFTQKYLNETGKKWQPVYCVTLVSIVLMVAYSRFTGTCS